MGTKVQKKNGTTKSSALLLSVVCSCLLLHELLTVHDNQTLVALVDYLASYVVGLALELDVSLHLVDASFTSLYEVGRINLINSSCFLILLIDATHTFDGILSSCLKI